MSEDRRDLNAWAKAQSFLAEAASIDPGATPTAVVHLSYYAMFHAARACVLRKRGKSPKTHNSLVQQFGELAREGDDALRASGRELNKVMDLRNKADYDDVTNVPPEKAEAARRSAVEFVTQCAKRFGFDSA